MTSLFGAVVFFAYSIVQGIAMVPIILLERGGPARLAAANPGSLPFSGFSLAVGTAAGCPAMLVFCALLILARRGPRLAEYLALRPLRPASLLGWVILMEILALGFSSLNELLGRPAPDFVVSAYASAVHLPFFWCAIAICAPVAEEVLFRGFLFPGLTTSRLGTGGTILLTSLVFMMVHGAQYEWFDLLQVGAVGVALGVARARSSSLLAPIAMHVALNLSSLILYALHLAGGSDARL